MSVHVAEAMALRNAVVVVVLTVLQLDARIFRVARVCAVIIFMVIAAMILNALKRNVLLIIRIVRVCAYLV